MTQNKNMTASQLKNAILQYAVQGKLVPQNPNDEPASVLLEKINKERKALVKAGKIKNEKPLLPITDEEMPFEIPKNWEWVRLGDLSLVITKGTTPRGGNLSYKDNGIGFLRVENFDDNGKFSTDSMKYIDEKTHIGLLKRSILQEDDLLVSIAGTLGRIAIVPKDLLPLNTNQAVAFVRFINKNFLNLEFIRFALCSPDIQKQLLEQTKVTAIPNLTLEIISNCFIPFPPLSEQKQIVERIEELLPLVNEYNKREQELTILDNDFPEKLKKSVLQAAIQGKLVPQDPNDEPASVLLERIRTEKKKLIREGKIKSSKEESIIFRRDNSHYEKLGKTEHCIDDEIPFEIPDNWAWTRLGAICEKLTDGSHAPPQNTFKGYPVISAKNIKNGIITFENVDRYTDEKGFNRENTRTNITKGDILLGIIGGSIGNLAVYTHSEKVIAQRSIAILRSFINNTFIINILSSPYIQGILHGNSSGTAQGGVYLGQLHELLIPIPPLSEQILIMEKIDKLFMNIRI